MAGIARTESAEVPVIVIPDTPYTANMRVLWKHQPSLAQQIDRVDEEDLIRCERSRSGVITCKVEGEKNQPVWLHSQYDPMREAAKWADGVMEQAQKQSQEEEGGYSPMCYFVDGFGLGYHVQELFSRLSGDAFIVAAESNVALLRSALGLMDYSKMLESDRLVILTTADRGEIFKKLEPRGNLLMMGVVFTRPLQRTNAEYYSRIHSLVGDFAAYMRSSLATMLGNSVLTCKNILHNLPMYVSTPSISILRNRFYRCPAVVVSAGPSLRKNIHVLKSVRDRVVVIAVQTTLKPLLAAGIRPDFVTSLDYHKASLRFFEGLTEAELGEVHLVAEPKANWDVIDYYAGKGPMSILGNDFADKVLTEGAFPHDRLNAGTTVAHLAFYLAEYIGADPIVFVGQDLAFTNNVYYSPGNALHALWKPELNRFFTIEMKEWERIARHKNILRKVKDYEGNDLYADEQMFTYLQQFEKDFAHCSSRVIDATEGGAKKHHCETMTLQEVANRYGTSVVDPEKFRYRKELRWLAPEKWQEGLAKVNQCLEAVADLREIVEETISLVREMLDLVDEHQDELNRKMVRLDELRVKVKQRISVYNLVSLVSQNAELLRYRTDRSLETKNLEGKDLQRRQLQRDVGYVSELKNGCDRLEGLLRECVERFEKRMQDSQGHAIGFTA